MGTGPDLLTRVRERDGGQGLRPQLGMALSHGSKIKLGRQQIRLFPASGVPVAGAAAAKFIAAGLALAMGPST